MKYPLIKVLLVVVFTGFIFSCENQEKEATDQILKKASQLVEEHPDSTLILLNTIESDILSKEKYFDFVLLQVQAKSKADLNITSEIDIFQAVDYYLDRKDRKKITLAWFYAGKVNQARGAYQNAMANYLEAIKYVGSEDEHLKGMIQNNIGHLYYEQMFIDEAMGWFRKAYQSFSNENEYHLKANTLIALGSVQVLAGKTDSALLHFREALNIAHAHEDTTILIWAIQNIGYTYYNSKDYNNAKKEFSQVIKHTCSEHERVISYINMIQICLDESKMDSVHYYKKLLDQNICSIKDTATLANVYRLYVEIGDQSRDSQQALYYAKKQIECLDALYEKQISQSVLDVQKRYDFETLLNDRNRFQLEKRERQNWINILIAFVLFICVVAVSFYLTQKMKMQKKLIEAERKREQLNKWANDEIIRKNEEIQQVIDEANRVKEEISLKERGLTKEKNLLDKESTEKLITFRQLLTQNFDIIGKVQKMANEMNDGMNPKEIVYKINHIVYGKTGKLDYNSIKNLVPATMDKVNRLDKRLDKRDKLTEPEKSACCLLCLGCDVWDISTFMDIESTTVYSRCTIIRRKLKMEKGGNIKDFIDQSIQFSDFYEPGL